MPKQPSIRLSEFDRIDRYFRPLAARYAGSLNLSDDGAILSASDAERVVTTDTMVEGTHFLSGTDPHLLAQKLLRVNLSDLAAMGATPDCYFLNLTLPKRIDEQWLHAFSDGLARDQETFGLHLAGGDSTSTDGTLTMTVTAVGEVAPGQALRRDAAKPGDVVLVTGKVGDGVLGLMAAMGGLGMLQPAMREALIKRYNLPNPRVRTGAMLWQHGARAAADVSDGLMADLGHICQASQVAAEVRLDDLPFSTPAKAAVAGGYVEAQTLAAGGDDYELVFTVPEAKVDALIGAIDADPTFGGVKVIGRIIDTSDGGFEAQLLDGGGTVIPMASKGWQHPI